VFARVVKKKSWLCPWRDISAVGAMIRAWLGQTVDPPKTGKPVMVFQPAGQEYICLDPEPTVS
jgi:hypothetical protein